jgi:hypothetical protein
MITKAKSCTGKIRHASYGGAVAHLKSLGNAQMRAYSCQFCKGFHIGHSNRGPKIQARFDQLIGPDPNITPKLSP